MMNTISVGSDRRNCQYNFSTLIFTSSLLPVATNLFFGVEAVDTVLLSDRLPVSMRGDAK